MQGSLISYNYIRNTKKEMRLHDKVVCWDRACKVCTHTNTCIVHVVMCALVTGLVYYPAAGMQNVIIPNLFVNLFCRAALKFLILGFKNPEHSTIF